jgi:hypothetical protein
MQDRVNTASIDEKELDKRNTEITPMAAWDSREGKSILDAYVVDEDVETHLNHPLIFGILIGDRQAILMPYQKR